MTQQEWDNASEEERNAEFERCKNPCYFYNTYWLDQNGDHPRQITQEEWNERTKYMEECERNRHSLKRIYRQPQYYEHT